MAHQVAEGLALPTEDNVADEYAWAQEFLAQARYEQYEVSNFAKPGKTCRHNWNIWRGEDYWGFGVSAVGTVEGVRHSHGDDLMEYIRLAAQGKDLLQLEPLDGKVREWERLMLGFRTNLGVLRETVEEYAAQRGIRYQDKFDRLRKEGFLLLENDHFRVTPKGYFVLNGILEILAA